MTPLLVSVIVITYNSSKTVLETLNSILIQSYGNIELIISDDCSSDNTVLVCNGWLGQHKDRFVSTNIATTERNAGISANCNRGWKAAKGEWIKLIAGDDILEKDCIKKYLEYINFHNDVHVLASRFQGFRVLEDGDRHYLQSHPHKKHFAFFTLSAEKQYRWLLTNSFNFAPSVIIKREMLESLDGFDEEFPFFEDLPMWLKITKRGIKINYLPETTVLYRIHDQSIRVASVGMFFNCNFRDSLHFFKKKHVYSHVPFYKLGFWQSEWAKSCQYWIIVKVFSNKKSWIAIFVYKLLLILDFSYLYNTLLKLTKGS